MMWFPGWKWFIEPSGGPVKPGTRWWRTLYDAPLIAHPAGAWGVVLFMALGGAGGFLLWWPVLLVEGVNQCYKGWHVKAYDRGLWREVLWRMLLSALATLPAWRWL